MENTNLHGPYVEHSAGIPADALEIVRNEDMLCRFCWGQIAQVVTDDATYFFCDDNRLFVGIEDVIGPDGVAYFQPSA